LLIVLLVTTAVAVPALIYRSVISINFSLIHRMLFVIYHPLSCLFI